MAYDPALLPSTKCTLSIEDYTTPTPVSYTLGIVDPNSLMPKVVDPLVGEEVFVTSTAGKIRYGYITNGVAGGQTYTFNVKMVDPKNQTDTTALLGLLRALCNNSVAGTGWSGNTYTNQLTGGGKLMAKFKFAFTNEVGTVNTFTIGSSVENIESNVSGEHMACTITNIALVAPAIA